MTGKTFGERLKSAREAVGKTQQEVANFFGVQRATVSQWENNETMPRAQKLEELARLVKSSTHYLLTGRNDKERGHQNNTEPGPEIVRFAPLLSWVSAGRAMEAPDEHLERETAEVFALPKKAGQHTFCLRVQGDSMASAFGRSYPDGCIIFVDPELRNPGSGRRVIAKLKGSNDVTFKVLVKEAGRAWLKPLNPQYPPILEPFKIIGTVIGKWEDE